MKGSKRPSMKYVCEDGTVIEFRYCSGGELRGMVRGARPAAARELGLWEDDPPKRMLVETKT